MTNDSPDRAIPRVGRPHKRPRWVTVSAIVVGLLIVIGIIVAVTGVGGDHDPGQHGGAGDPAAMAVVEIPIPL